MSGSDNQNSTQNDSGAGADSSDLSAALGGGGETEFVVSGDEKKNPMQGLMYLLLLLAVGGGVTYFMYQRSGPATAQAGVTPEAQAAEQTINQFLTSGPDGIKMMQSMLKDTEKVVQQFLDYPSVTQIPLSALHTNPFRFAKAEAAASADAEVSKRKREEEKQAAIKASEALQLQSIVHSGSRKACMINNTLYSEGQQVERFTIEKIEPARVIVKTVTYRFELKMQR